MLKVIQNNYYRLKKGDTLSSVAKAYHLPLCVLIGLNGLKETPWEGYVCRLPEGKYNLYTVQGGDSKEGLCGSKERYRAINYTDAFFVGMKIFL